MLARPRSPRHTRCPYGRAPRSGLCGETSPACHTRHRQSGFFSSPALLGMSIPTTLFGPSMYSSCLSRPGSTTHDDWHSMACPCSPRHHPWSMELAVVVSYRCRYRDQLGSGVVIGGLPATGDGAWHREWRTRGPCSIPLLSCAGSVEACFAAHPLIPWHVDQGLCESRESSHCCWTKISHVER